MAADPDVPWDLVSRVRRSERKTEIIKLLRVEPASASELAEKMDIETATVSNHFYKLKTMNPPLVVCITPDQPHHRLYGLTEYAEEIVNHI